MEKRNSVEIHRVQLFFLKHLLTNANQNCPFYQSKFDSSNVNLKFIAKLQDLSNLPVTTKKDIRIHVNEMINSKLNKKHLKKYYSSGSTGEPKVFYQDRESQSWRLAAWYLGWRRAGYNFGDKWIKTNKTSKRSLLNVLSTRLKGCVPIDLGKFDREHLDQALNMIIQNNPDLIYSNTNTLYVLSKYIMEESNSKPKLKFVITQGSILFHHFRETIENVFQTKVYDTYGGDGIVISGQCRFGNYHVNDLGVIIEVVDDHYQVLPNESLGRILVTDLHNYAMPMIRYEIGDLGIKHEKKCECGSQYSIMAQPLGRDTDIIKLSNNINLTVHQFGSFFIKLPEIIQFQIIEEEVDHLLLRLIVTSDFDELIKLKILRMIDEISNNIAVVRIKLVENIPLEKSNKRRYMIGKNNSQIQ